MARLVLRRCALIPIALWLVHLFGFTYALVVRPIRAARNPFFTGLAEPAPILPAYSEYMQTALGSGLGQMPGSKEAVAEAIARAAGASVGLLLIATTLSVISGLALGFAAVRHNPPRVSRGMTILSTIGLATPSFYLGTIFIVAMFTYVLSRGAGTPMPLPTQGFGWDTHLILPTLALMLRPTVQIARVTSGLLVTELDKPYIVAARSLGHNWRSIRWHVALRNVIAPIILTIAGAFRLLMAELIVVEWLFKWPGIGHLLATALVPALGTDTQETPMFLNPPVIAALLVVFAAIFLVTDLIAALLVRAADPRLRAHEPEKTHA